MFIPGLASAQGQGWSVLSGKTVGTGTNVFHGEIGWPGLSGTLLHGVNSNFDLGGKFTFNYGFEGATSDINPGFKLQGALHFQVAQVQKVSLGLHFEPGLLLYREGGATFGITLPVSFVAGIQASSNLMINVGLDVPLAITFGDGSTAFVPILFGGGMEYFLDSRTALTFNMRLGPGIVTRGGGGTVFVLESLFGVAYRF
jgi:hypothetical protein